MKTVVGARHIDKHNLLKEWRCDTFILFELKRTLGFKLIRKL